MGFREEPSHDLKWRERRRGARMNSQVRIAVQWKETEGKTSREEAVTRIVNPTGCLVVLRSKLALDQPVEVTNLVNQQKNAALVAWIGKERSEGWEYGIELLKPGLDFWGIEL